MSGANHCENSLVFDHLILDFGITLVQPATEQSFISNYVELNEKPL